MSTKKFLDQYEKLKTDKANWNNSWQLVGRYIHTRKQDFTGKKPKGAFLDTEIFDTTAITARNRSASALVGMLWAGGKSSVKMLPARDIEEQGYVSDFFNAATERLGEELDHPNSGLGLALNEYANDLVSFGTAGVGVFEGDESALLFRPYSVQTMAVDEGLNGRIDTIFTEFEWEIRRVMQEFPEEMLSEKIRDAISQSRLDEKVKLLNVVQPRATDRKDSISVLDAPFLEMWIEIDSKHKILESGFFEVPISVGRLEKRIGEVYGRGWGMQAMPDVLMINQVSEDVGQALEKTMDPPLAMFSDSVTGGQEIDTSAKALNVISTPTGRLEGGSPVFPLFSVGDPSGAFVLIEKLEQRISDHFNVDILLDFANQKEMTLGEAQIRNNLRFMALQGIISRQLAELFNPLISRSIKILMRQGKLGINPNDQEAVTIARQQGRAEQIIPESILNAIANNDEWFTLSYNTPAARMSKSEQVNGILQLLQVITSLGEEAIMRVNIDDAIKFLADKTAVPNDVLRTDDEVEDIKNQRKQLMQQQMQMQNAQQGAEIAKTAGEAANER